MAYHLCSTWLRHHLGPLIIIAVGMGFAIVGAIPVAVNFSIGANNNSSTIIGVGFIGFGLLLMVPGFFWCVVLQLSGLRRVCGFCCCCCDGRRWRDEETMQESQEMMPESRPSRCSSEDAVTGGDEEVSPSSAKNNCIFTKEEVEENEEEREEEKEEDAGSDVAIVIPPIHKTSPAR